MKKILILLTVVLFLLTSCATFPPPQIQDGRYINPKYSFSIEVPDGWLQTEKAPPWLKEILNEDGKSLIRIMFFNNNTNGLIYVASHKPIPSIPFSSLDEISSFDNVIPGSFHDYVYQSAKQEIEKRKRQLIEDAYIKNYSYKIYSVKKYTEKFSYETEFVKQEIRVECMMYNCQENDSCIIIFCLNSNIKTFDENYGVFDKVVNSFRKIKYTPENKTKDMSENLIKDLINMDWIGTAMGWWAAGGM